VFTAKYTVWICSINDMLFWISYLLTNLEGLLRII